MSPCPPTDLRPCDYVPQNACNKYGYKPKKILLAPLAALFCTLIVKMLTHAPVIAMVNLVEYTDHLLYSTKNFGRSSQRSLATCLEKTILFVPHF